MKIITVILFVNLLCFTAFAQKIIIINQSPQEVPSGKKWVLLPHMSTVIEVNDGVFESGNFCNAQVFSNPGILSAIVEQDGNYRPSLYQVLFEGISKVPYTNDFTLKISNILSFKVNRGSISFSPQNSLIFYPGQKVFVNGCLESIQMIEKPFTKIEENALRKKEELEEKQYEVTVKKMAIGNTNGSIDRTSELNSDINIDASNEAKDTLHYQSDPNQIFTSVQQAPEYPGGMKAFSIFLSANIKYPQEAKSNNIQGKVFLRFVIEKDGSLTHIIVLRSPGHGLDIEAVRVLKLSPKWNPAYQNDKPVRSEFTLPIDFSL